MDGKPKCFFPNPRVRVTDIDGRVYEGNNGRLTDAMIEVLGVAIVPIHRVAVIEPLPTKAIHIGDRVLVHYQGESTEGVVTDIDASPANWEFVIKRNDGLYLIMSTWIVSVQKVGAK